MQYKEKGRIVRGVGGLYEIRLDAGDTPLSGLVVRSRAKGNFRHEGETPLVGDRVEIQYDDVAVARYTGTEGAVHHLQGPSREGQDHRPEKVCGQCSQEHRHHRSGPCRYG